jgi:Fe-S oxidoreductase
MHARYALSCCPGFFTGLLRNGIELAYIRNGMLAERLQDSGSVRAIRDSQGEMTMQVALMVPCYVHVVYPHVGIATLELLEKLGAHVASMCKICSSFRQPNALNMEI